MRHNDVMIIIKLMNAPPRCTIIGQQLPQSNTIAKIMRALREKNTKGINKEENDIGLTNEEVE